ncbi:MAG: hypothetical protein ACRENP_01175 [Longimicrobiales bacterium]
MLAGEVDPYTFAGQAGQTILLTLGETAGFFGSVASARVTLLAPSGAQVATFTSNGQQRLTLQQTGNYRITVNASNLVATVVTILVWNASTPPLLQMPV